MIASLKDYLPELVNFTKSLAAQYQGKQADWQTFAQQCDAFYTETIMQKIDSVATGWLDMASHRDRQTLYHVSAVFLALYHLPEYQNMTPQQQTLSEWAVLFHDITKIPIQGEHDYIHGFRSAAVAGKALTKLGYPLNEGQSITDLDAWQNLTNKAICYSEAHQETIQDNSKLPEIIPRLRALHGKDACSIVLAILLHISIPTQPEYPILAPLSDDKILDYLSPDDLLIIEVMYLADSAGWGVFENDSSIPMRQRQNIKEVFSTIKRKFGI